MSPTLYIVFGVVLVALILLLVFYFRKKKQEKAARSAPAEADAPGGNEIAVLVHEAEAKLAAAKLPGAKVANLPVYLFLGEPGTTKTSVVLHSGLEPELVSGQVYQGGNVAPTRTANFWFSRRSLFVEAGGTLHADPGRWRTLIKKLQPRASVVGKGEQAGRAAVVCFDSENFTKPGSMDIAVNMARNLRAKLGEISQAMGINLPVYVLFTRVDRLPYFTEFVRNLNNDEATQVVGATLPMLDRRSEGVYAEEETARLTWQFERLFQSLADARPEFLAREMDAARLPAAYEFPREFRKIRPALVQFLVDLCRPSQLTVGPFLRGFYFTGVRPIVINDSAPVAPAQAPQQQFPAPSGATGIFQMRRDAAPEAALQPPPKPAAASRKVPQWLFLSHLFNDVLLADRAAMGASGASTRTSKGRRILFIAAAALCFLLTIAFTISFFNNRALENRVRDASKALASVETGGTELASLDSLRKLDTLREALVTLVDYRHNGAPLFYRWLLYIGDDLYPVARKAYFDRFKQVMFGQTQDGVLHYLQGLPSTPGPEYSPTYDALKAYLITTYEYKRSTHAFLTPVLMNWWMGSRTLDPERQQLARKQFDFYADELKEDNPYSKEADMATVERSRRYLKQFAGMERVYAFMLAEADKQNKPVNFNRDFPGSAQTVLNSKEVRGAFTKGGYTFMKDAIAHADKYFNGEPWVLGDQGSGIGDRAGLEAALRARYYADFIAQWRAYIKASSVVRYGSLADASHKLKDLSGNQSALMELFALATQNTAVDDPKVAAAFQPVQSVVPPPATQYTAPSNQPYLQALLQLSSSIDAASQGGQPSDAAAAQTLNDARQAKMSTAQMARAFTPDPEGHVDQQVQKLLEDPITNAEGMLKRLGPEELNAKGRAMCGQINPVLAKYPFNPRNTTEATAPDITSVFKPGTGMLWQFVDSNFQKVLTKQGTQYVANPSGGVSVTPEFLRWLNRASAFAEAAFAGGAADPHFRYTMKPEVSPDLESIKLTIDGQVNAFAAAVAVKPYDWPGTAAGLDLILRFQGGQELEAASVEGRWAVFHFVDKADVHTGGHIELKPRTGTGPLRNPVTKDPLVVKFDISATPPIFDPGYFVMPCVPTVAR